MNLYFVQQLDYFRYPGGGGEGGHRNPNIHAMSEIT